MLKQWLDRIKTALGVAQTAENSAHPDTAQHTTHETSKQELQKDHPHRHAAQGACIKIHGKNKQQKGCPNTMPETCRILVVSDVHGSLRNMRWIFEHETADAMFFLGDGIYDLNAALQLKKTPVPYPIYRARGNCDEGYEEPTEGLAPFAGVLFFYTHGHRYGVKMGTEQLAEFAGARGADVALCGHTHQKTLGRGAFGVATVFNPGSLRFGDSYGVITITDGKCEFSWKKVPQ